MDLPAAAAVRGESVTGNDLTSNILWRSDGTSFPAAAAASPRARLPWRDAAPRVSPPSGGGSSTCDGRYVCQRGCSGEYRVTSRRVVAHARAFAS